MTNPVPSEAIPTIFAKSLESSDLATHRGAKLNGSRGQPWLSWPSGVKRTP